MSFQAYLDNIEDKTSLTPRQFVGLAHEKGIDRLDVKAGTIVDWLKQDYGLGRGHAMALVHVIKNGPKIDAKHVGSGGAHSDPSDILWLDGKATSTVAPTGTVMDAGWKLRSAIETAFPDAALGTFDAAGADVVVELPAHAAIARMAMAIAGR